jgi:hypothetical protein
MLRLNWKKATVQRWMLEKSLPMDRDVARLSSTSSSSVEVNEDGQPVPGMAGWGCAVFGPKHGHRNPNGIVRIAPVYLQTLGAGKHL